MPYIHPMKREQLKNGEEMLQPGELNYAITLLIHRYLDYVGRNYRGFNDVVGALESAKLELYRRHIAPYEDQKIAENGDVPESDRAEAPRK